MTHSPEKRDARLRRIRAEIRARTYDDRPERAASAVLAPLQEMITGARRRFDRGQQDGAGE